MRIETPAGKIENNTLFYPFLVLVVQKCKKASAEASENEVFS